MNVGKQKIALGCYTDASHPNGLKMLELDEGSGAMSVVAEHPVSNALYQALSLDGKNPAGTDPIKAFIIKGFGIARGQAPAKDFFGRDDLIESMKSLWNKRVPSLITCRGEVAAVAAAEKSEACP